MFSEKNPFNESRMEEFRGQARQVIEKQKAAGYTIVIYDPEDAEAASFYMPGEPDAAGYAGRVNMLALEIEHPKGEEEKIQARSKRVSADSNEAIEAVAKSLMAGAEYL